jgi:hypothetical protein
MRLDESEDSDFYVVPRFVQHADEHVSFALTGEQWVPTMLYGNAAPEVGSNWYTDTTPLAPCCSALYAQLLQPYTSVLDLCSSWDSHLPPGLKLANVVGHGMSSTAPPAPVAQMTCNQCELMSSARRHESAGAPTQCAPHTQLRAGQLMSAALLN